MYKWTDGTDYLMHHGIKGQKWGVRRYQNADRTLTPEGRARYKAIAKTNVKRAKVAGSIAGVAGAATKATQLYKASQIPKVAKAVNRTAKILALASKGAKGSAAAYKIIASGKSAISLGPVALSMLPAGAIAAGSLAVAAYGGYRLLANKYRENTSYDREYSKQLDREYAKEYY